MPKRIQRRRVKGWKMPPNTISVTRPTDWGNPFRLGDYVVFPEIKNPIVFVGYWITSEQYATPAYQKLDTVEKVLEAYETYLKRSLKKKIDELRGKVWLVGVNYQKMANPTYATQRYF